MFKSYRRSMASAAVQAAIEAALALVKRDINEDIKWPGRRLFLWTLVPDVVKTQRNQRSIQWLYQRCEQNRFYITAYHH